MSFAPREYLEHILVEADYLISRSSGLTWERFASDETLRRAFVRSLEVIGEAAKKLPDDFRARHPSVGWRSMAGMRDRLIHAFALLIHNRPGPVLSCTFTSVLVASRTAK